MRNVVKSREMLITLSKYYLLLGKEGDKERGMNGFVTQKCRNKCKLNKIIIDFSVIVIQQKYFDCNLNVIVFFNLKFANQKVIII